MNRSDLQQLAHIRLAEANALLKEGLFSGAYYLAGYAVECGLKASIAKQTQEFSFPDKAKVNDSYSHDLVKLLKLSGLEQDLNMTRITQPDLGPKWAIVQSWSESSRYSVWQEVEARAMVGAVGNSTQGVFSWLVQRW